MRMLRSKRGHDLRAARLRRGLGRVGEEPRPVAIWTMSAAEIAKSSTPTTRKKIRTRWRAANVVARPHVVQKLVSPATRWKTVAAMPARYPSAMNGMPCCVDDRCSVSVVE